MTVDTAIRAAFADAVRAEGDRIVRAIVTELRASRPPRLLSVADAAAELGISACSVRRHVADGSLPSRRVGARVLIDMTAATPAGDDEIARRAREAREGGQTMPSDALPGAHRRGVDVGAAGVTPLRRRGGGQS